VLLLQSVLKGKNTYISLFHLLVFCMALLPGALLHTHHSHDTSDQLSACQLHIEYHDLALKGKCEHKEHYSASADPCFACVFHYTPVFTDTHQEISFTVTESLIDAVPAFIPSVQLQSLLSYNRGPPVSAA
jgi:hypothetical protein